MITTTKTIKELLTTGDSPLPLEVIPNNMGINLANVEALTWTRQDDGQLVNLTIHFIPGPALDLTEWEIKAEKLLHDPNFRLTDDVLIKAFAHYLKDTKE